MMTTRSFLIALITAACTLVTASDVSAQVNPGTSDRPEGRETGVRRHFVGSSMFVAVNAIPLTNPPSFYQLNYGYHITPRDVVSVEAITWTYNAPAGIPWGDMGAVEEEYPGSVREYGLGVAYQRFLWKDAYTAIHALPLLKDYRDADNEHIQNGVRLFLTLRAGYQVRLFGDRFFLEPSVAVTHWPIDANAPELFVTVENRWPTYFLFEPGLHFGVKF